MEYDNVFWEYLEKIVQDNEIIIDRLKGTRHPKCDEKSHRCALGQYRRGLHRPQTNRLGFLAPVPASGFHTILGAILGAGFVGKLVGFCPIDASITAGLYITNIGGTDDVAVLSAADRMELMPFAQISSRIGGTFILILSSVLLKIIGG
jgi:hypothetical protein